MGTPDFSLPVLEMLLANTDVVAVVTQPDKAVGRKKEIVYSPVKKLALEHNIPVFQPTKIRADYEFLNKFKIDLIVTCAYGQIIPKVVLDLPKYGAINVHASLLPKYRGAAPIQWALMNGDAKTGVTIMYMDEGMDSGDIIKTQEIPITASDNVGTLHEKLAILGAQTLQEVLPNILASNIKRMPQSANYTLAPMIKRADEKIDFADTGLNIINKIRALDPWPLANFSLDGKEIKVIKAEFKKEKTQSSGKIVLVTKDKLGISCQDGIIYLKEIKPFGKKKMNIASFLNGIKKEELINKVVD